MYLQDFSPGDDSVRDDVIRLHIVFCLGHFLLCLGNGQQLEYDHACTVVTMTMWKLTGFCRGGMERVVTADVLHVVMEVLCFSIKQEKKMK